MLRSFATGLVLFVLFFVLILESAACTIFVLVTKDRVLFGNNEDYIKPGAITFVPASEGKFGRVNFGFHDIITIDSFAQGSMNEKGLVFDAAVVNSIKWKADKKKKEFEGNLVDHIMDTCQSIKEVESKFRAYNCKYLSMCQFLFADATGESVLVSWTPDRGVIFKRRAGKYQIATNHRQCSSTYRCQRNMRVHQVLSKPHRDPVSQVRDALNAVHQEGKGFTSYSTIYDLKKKRLIVYNLSNFEESVEFDLAKELGKGKRQIRLNSIFKKSPSIRKIKSGNRTSFGTEVKVEVAELDNCVGHYQSADNPKIQIQIQRREDRLLVKSPGKPDAVLFPEGEGVFRIHPDRGQVSFRSAPSKKASAMVVHKQKDVILKRVKESNN